MQQTPKGNAEDGSSHISVRARRTKALKSYSAGSEYRQSEP